MNELSQNVMHSSVKMRIPSDQLIDQFGRYKHKLRISLTDRCNFRCSYCMPDQPEWLAKNEILSFEALLRLCKLMISLGITHIRLTGGEPLMRKGVVNFIADLNQLRVLGLQRISMTTNAFYLEQYAEKLKQAGLDDLNISLDSIHPETFKQMTKKPLAPVLRGIKAAKHANLPIKLNCVLVAGQNEHEIVELSQWAYQQQIPLRFIEYMPLDQADHWQRHKVVIEDTIIEALQPYFHIKKQDRTQDPATIYLLNQNYSLGIISTISKPFCQSCDRLRVTATGELFTCLFANSGIPLNHLLQNDVDFHQLESVIKETVWYKKAGFISHQQAPIRKISMHAIGG